VRNNALSILALYIILLDYPDGVYKSGFAVTQSAYEAAVKPLFASLDRLEKMLEGKEYLVGNRLTEADVRLYTTIVSAQCSGYL
jgi:glutathionyl-hydroquinone reductase